MRSWFKKLFRRKEAYVGTFKLRINSEIVYVHCFETKNGKRRTEVINCDNYPASKWRTYYEQTEIYQLRIRPWEDWGKKDDGIFTYSQVMEPKEEFKAKLKGDATWEIKHDHS